MTVGQRALGGPPALPINTTDSIGKLLSIFVTRPWHHLLHLHQGPNMMAVNISAGGGPEGEWGSAARAGQAGQVMRGTGE